MPRALCFVGLLAILASCSSGWSDERVQKAVPVELQGPLKTPDKVTFFTIFHTEQDQEEVKLSRAEIDKLPKLDEFHVLGSQVVTADEGRQLIDSFMKAVEKGETAGVKCFQPHHAIRVEGGSKTVEVIVCFKCNNYKVNPDGGYNNVAMSEATGMEDVWRGIVAKYGLKDISKKES